jgi:hypothetical protein
MIELIALFNQQQAMIVWGVPSLNKFPGHRAGSHF